jgi:glycosyltransferase involved in cell wall biosynthesis
MKDNPIRKIAVIGVGSATWQGGIQYIINFIAGLNKLAERQGFVIEVILIKTTNQNFDNLKEFPFLQFKVVDKNMDIPQVNFFQKIINYAKYKMYKLNYSPKIINYLKQEQVEFVYPMALPKSSGLNAAGWVADFQHRNFPDTIDHNFTKQAEGWINSEFKFSNKVVLSSEFCKKDCSKFFPEYVYKTVVMPFAVHISDSFFKPEFLTHTKIKYDITKPFFLISNLFATTKNHKIIFEALGILKSKGIIIDIFCTGNIVDSRDLDFPNHILETITKNKIRNQVHLVGLIPREEQMSLYRLCLAMIQPSVSEGWSTCVEEAKAIGKDMLLSNIEVHKEQWPNNPNFFDPYNANDLAHKMDAIYNLNATKVFPDLKIETVAKNNYKNNLNSFAEAILKVITFEIVK